jgi:hypothetical protein
MKTPKHLFRAIPPKEFVEEILRHCGFDAAFGDRRVVSKVTLQRGVHTQEDWLPFLEPYYLPCKARRFFGAAVGPLDANRMATILRHILRPYDYDFVAQEVAEHGAKQTLYQIQPVSNQTIITESPELEVTFT